MNESRVFSGKMKIKHRYAVWPKGLSTPDRDEKKCTENLASQGNFQLLKHNTIVYIYMHTIILDYIGDKVIAYEYNYFYGIDKLSHIKLHPHKRKRKL